MLALRLARGSRPLVQLRRLLVAAASAGAGFLLLCPGVRGGHPAEPDGALARLLWCLVPLAATVQFAVAVARTDPADPRPGGRWSAAGLGPVRLSVLPLLDRGDLQLGSGAVGLLQLLASPCSGSSALDLRRGTRGRGAAHSARAGAFARVAAALTLPARRRRWPRGRGRRARRRHRLPVAGGGPAVPLARPASGRRPCPAAALRPHAAPAGLPWGVALTAVGSPCGVSAPRGTRCRCPAASVRAAPPCWPAGSLTVGRPRPGRARAGPPVRAAAGPAAPGRAAAAGRAGAPGGGAPDRPPAGRAVRGRPPASPRPPYATGERRGTALGPLTGLAAALVAVCVAADPAHRGAGGQQRRARRPPRPCATSAPRRPCCAARRAAGQRAAGRVASPDAGGRGAADALAGRPADRPAGLSVGRDWPTPHPTDREIETARRIRPGRRARLARRLPHPVGRPDGPHVRAAGHRHLGRPSSSAARWSPRRRRRSGRGGALVFPPVPDLPFDPYRGAALLPRGALRRAGRRGYEAHARRPRLRLVPADQGRRRHLRLDAALHPRRRRLRRPGRAPRRRPGGGRDGRARAWRAAPTPTPARPGSAGRWPGPG